MRFLGTSLSLLVAATAATLGIVIPAAHAASSLPTSTKLVITGHGWGHGHGMSQYGARGAAEDGLTWRQIVAFYYPGTKLGSVSGKVRVLITADTTRSVKVGYVKGLTVTGGGKTWKVAAKHPKATRFEIAPVSATKDAIEYKTSTGWHRMATSTHTLTFHTGTRPVRLYLPHGSATYVGELRAARDKAGSKDRDTVNILGYDHYVQGVVPREMPASWGASAVRAQAVAARTYAAFEHAENAKRYYDLCDTSACQVYGGYSARQPASDAAVKATSGKVVTYQHKPAFTQFASSNGGELLAGSQPYLVSKKDPYEKDSGNPYETWTTTVTVKQIKARWPSAGGVVSVSVQTVAGTSGRWVSTVTIKGTKKTYVEPASTFVSWAGLRSASFSLKVDQPKPSDAATPSPSASRSSAG